MKNRVCPCQLTLKAFTATHPCEEITVGGARYRYILEGEADGKTLAFLNGGMNTLEMWMHNPQISYVSGGHLSTVLKTDGYIRTIRSFLNAVRE